MASIRNARGASTRWVVSLLVITVITLIACHAAVLGYKKFADVDEGYCSALAERLLEGYKLYDGAVSQRGPLMYYGFAGMAWLTGWDNVLGLRCWALAFCIAHVLLVYWAGSRLLSRPAGVIAALASAYGLCFGFPARDVMALHGEAMQLPALIVCAVVGARAMRYRPGSRERLLRLVGSGIALGVAIAIKQSVAAHILPVAIWLLIDARKRRGGWGVALREVVLYGASVLIVPALFVLNAARQGTFSELVYYTITYNLRVHLHPTDKFGALFGQFIDRLNERTLFFLALVFVIGRALPGIARRLRAAWIQRSVGAFLRGFGVRGYLGMHLAIGLATAASMSRFFPHYFLQAMPFLSILLGAAVAPFFDVRRWAPVARSVTTTLAVFLLLYSGTSAYFLEKIDGRIAHEPLVERLANYLQASTTPDQRIFVWGFSPWLYAYSHRKPAGRYVFETYVTGFVPWFWEDLDVEKERVVPGSMEALLSDLEREKPEVVVDAGAVLFGRPIRSYQASLDWLKTNYCFEFRFGAFDLYRRKKTPDQVCEAAHFPKMHAPVDFYGGGAPYVLMPLTLDYAQSDWLPPGEYDKPQLFATQTLPPAADALRDRKREKEEAEGLKKLGVKSIKELLPPSPCDEKTKEGTSQERTAP